MYKERIYQMLRACKGEPDDVDFVSERIDNIANYANTVKMEEMRIAMAEARSNSPIDFQQAVMQIDQARRSAHNVALDSVAQFNRLADYYQVPHILDYKDKSNGALDLQNNFEYREKVHQFCLDFDEECLRDVQGKEISVEQFVQKAMDVIEGRAEPDKEVRKEAEIELPKVIQDRMKHFELAIRSNRPLSVGDQSNLQEIADSISEKYTLINNDGATVSCEPTPDGIKQYMQVALEVARRDIGGTQTNDLNNERIDISIAVDEIAASIDPATQEAEHQSEPQIAQEQTEDLDAQDLDDHDER